MLFRSPSVLIRNFNFTFLLIPHLKCCHRILVVFENVFDIGVKANQNRSLDEVYASCKRQVNSLSPAFGLVELTALAVTAHQVNQALVQNVQKTWLNAGNINQNMAVANSLTVAMNLKTAIDKMAVIIEKFKNLTGNENAQAMGNAQLADGAHANALASPASLALNLAAVSLGATDPAAQGLDGLLGAKDEDARSTTWSAIQSALLVHDGDVADFDPADRAPEHPLLHVADQIVIIDHGKPTKIAQAFVDGEIGRAHV